MSEVRIGTSGWSYPGGQGTWNGIFYPRKTSARKRAPKFDELSFYAEHFDTVEINSTFYRVPTPEVARGWAERTPAAFEFSLKLFQKFTHPQMFEKATGADPFDLNQKDVDEFRAGLDPLASAGKLGALLAQFPASFKNDRDTRGYLEWLLKAFKDYPIAVELRHRTWSDDPGETLQVLNAFGAAWAQIDEPKFRLSIRQSLLPNVKTFYYLRLHGRNAAQWWSHKNSEDRYNYLYTSEELEPFAEAAKEALRLRQQPLLGEVGRECRDSETQARSAPAWRILGGVRRDLSGPQRHREAPAASAHSRTEAFLRMSAIWILAATSCPLITWPNTVNFESSSGAARSVM